MSFFLGEPIGTQLILDNVGKERWCFPGEKLAKDW